MTVTVTGFADVALWATSLSVNRTRPNLSRRSAVCLENMILTVLRPPLSVTSSAVAITRSGGEPLGRPVAGAPPMPSRLSSGLASSTWKYPATCSLTV